MSTLKEKNIPEETVPVNLGTGMSMINRSMVIIFTLKFPWKSRGVSDAIFITLSAWIKMVILCSMSSLHRPCVFCVFCLVLFCFVSCWLLCLVRFGLAYGWLWCLMDIPMGSQDASGAMSSRSPDQHSGSHCGLSLVCFVLFVCYFFGVWFAFLFVTLIMYNLLCMQISVDWPSKS